MSQEELAECILLGSCTGDGAGPLQSTRASHKQQGARTHKEIRPDWPGWTLQLGMLPINLLLRGV